jgi:hypothetical protein
MTLLPLLHPANNQTLWDSMRQIIRVNQEIYSRELSVDVPVIIWNTLSVATTLPLARDLIYLHPSLSSQDVIYIYIYIYIKVIYNYSEKLSSNFQLSHAGSWQTISSSPCRFLHRPEKARPSDAVKGFQVDVCVQATMGAAWSTHANAM